MRGCTRAASLRKQRPVVREALPAGIRMPSFFGYMLYSGLVLTPLFVCITFLFFV